MVCHGCVNTVSTSQGDRGGGRGLRRAQHFHLLITFIWGSQWMLYLRHLHFLPVTLWEAKQMLTNSSQRSRVEVKPFWKNSHRHIQRLASLMLWVLLNPTKREVWVNHRGLTVETSQCNVQVTVIMHPWVESISEGKDSIQIWEQWRKSRDCRTAGRHREWWKGLKILKTWVTRVQP